MRIGLLPVYASHWLFEGLNSVWAPPDRGRKYCCTTATDTSPPVHTLGMGPYMPAIFELHGSGGKVVCTSFHVGTRYPDTVRLLTNFCQHHANSMTMAHQASPHHRPPTCVLFGTLTGPDRCWGSTVCSYHSQDRKGFHEWLDIAGQANLLSLEFDGTVGGQAGGTEVRKLGGAVAEAAGEVRIDCRVAVDVDDQIEVTLTLTLTLTLSSLNLTRIGGLSPRQASRGPESATPWGTRTPLGGHNRECYRCIDR